MVAGAFAVAAAGVLAGSTACLLAAWFSPVGCTLRALLNIFLGLYVLLASFSCTATNVSADAIVPEDESPCHDTDCVQGHGTTAEASTLVD